MLPLEEGYGRLMVPKLILQPIFENIIKHIVEKDSAVQIVTIRIHCMKSDGRLEICVEDNGTALPEDRLQSIRENLEHGQTSGTGLINVKRRMELSGIGTLQVGRSELGGLRASIILYAE